MSAATWREMAKRLLDGNGGSTVQWTRRTMTIDGPAGTATVTATSTLPVRVAQLTAEQRDLFASESWQTAAVRLAVAADGFPFTAETHSSEPEVRFDDTVSWLGIDRRVTSIESWAAPGGPGLPPQHLAFFVALGA